MTAAIPSRPPLSPGEEAAFLMEHRPTAYDPGPVITEAEYLQPPSLVRMDAAENAADTLRALWRLGFVGIKEGRDEVEAVVSAWEALR